MIEAKQIPRRAFLAGASVLGKLGALAVLATWPISAARAGGPPKQTRWGSKGPLDLTRVDLRTFLPLVGTAFQVQFKPGMVATVTLAHAAEIHVTDGPGIHRVRVPFSLLFVAPRNVVFRQGMYPVRHPVLGTFSLFLVPIGPPAPMAYYEAVFG